MARPDSARSASSPPMATSPVWTSARPRTWTRSPTRPSFRSTGSQSSSTSVCRPSDRQAYSFDETTKPLSAKRCASEWPPEASRVVSLSSFWLKKDRIASVMSAFCNSDNHLSLVLADQFDPLRSTEQGECLQQLVDLCTADGRQIELLRTDTHAIAFAVAGGTHGAIGLTRNGRHHPQRLNASTRAEHELRQQSPLIWTPALMSWQRGVRLGALEPFNGAGYTDCLCTACDGRSLLRFNREWPESQQTSDSTRNCTTCPVG